MVDHSARGCLAHIAGNGWRTTVAVFYPGAEDWSSARWDTHGLRAAAPAKEVGRG